MDDMVTTEILRNISIPPILTYSDKIEIFHYVQLLLDSYINDNILSFVDEDFDEELDNYLYDNVISTYENIYSFNTELNLQEIINDVKETHFLSIIPNRSNAHSFRTLSQNKINSLNLKIDFLRNIPQPTQRTEAWYEFRHNLITASSAWKVFGSQAIKNSLIYEKCKPYEIFGTSVVNTESTLHWGQKFEQVSVNLYEELYNTKVEDFGCIKDDTYSFLGASPDGINVDENSPLYGRMLEIKNIVNRKITGIPKKEYWIQMQLQMSVCKLNECDFLETKFFEYNSYNDFLTDSSLNNNLLSKEGEKKGMFMYFNGSNGSPKYIYPPTNLNFEELELWEQTQLENTDLMWIRNVYWKLEILSCVLVCRNKQWFNEAVKKIGELWSIIETERVSGYQHRAPNKRAKSEPIVQNKCLLNIVKLSSSSSCSS